MSDLPIDQWPDRFGDELFAFAMRRMWCVQSAEDCVQDTFLAAAAHLARGESIADQRAWLFATLRRRMIDVYRRQAHRGTEPLANVIEPSVSDSAGDGMQWSELQTEMLACASDLTPRLREAFMLRAVSGLASEEVVAMTGVDAKTLATRLYRARLAVRDCMDRKGLL